MQSDQSSARFWCWISYTKVTGLSNPYYIRCIRRLSKRNGHTDRHNVRETRSSLENHLISENKLVRPLEAITSSTVSYLFPKRPDKSIRCRWMAAPRGHVVHVTCLWAYVIRPESILRSSASGNSHIMSITVTCTSISWLPMVFLSPEDFYILIIEIKSHKMVAYLAKKQVLTAERLVKCPLAWPEKMKIVRRNVSTHWNS